MFAIENPSTGKSEDKFERIDDSQRDDILDRSTAAYDAWPVSYTHLTLPTSDLV